MKNKFLFKTASVLLGAAMVISLAACGTNGTTDGDKATTLTWYYPGTAQSDQNMVMNEINAKLKEKYNIEIDARVIDSGSYQEKMNMVIASNEDYDLCFTSNWANKYIPNVLKKAYAPLNQLIDENAPALRSALPDLAWEISRFGNDIYAVPNYQMIFYQPTLCVPTELYNKYKDDLANIQKPQDLESYLQKIKANETGYYPFRVMPAAVWLDYEGVYGSEVCVKEGEEHPQAFNPYTTSEYKDYIMLMSDWFSKGYIRKDVASVTDDNDDIKNMKYAVWYTQYKPGLEYFNTQGKKMDVTYLPLSDPYLSNGAGTQAMTAINAGSAHQKEAIKLLEVLNTDKEIYNMICFGLEGVHYTKTGDNTIKVSGDSKYSPKTDWEFGNQFNAFVTEGKAPTVWEETDAMNRQSVPSKLFGFVFDPENVKTEIANISSVVSEYAYLENGTTNAQENYNAFVQKLNASGIEKAVQETQKQIDGFLN